VTSGGYGKEFKGKGNGEREMEIGENKGRAAR